MEIEQKHQLLKESRLFKGCDEPTLTSIAEDTYFRAYKKGALILTGESTIHKISIVVNEGRMKIYAVSGNTFEEYTIYVLSKGDLFNIITLVDGKKDDLSAVALDDLEILHCNIDLARKWIEKHERFNRNILQYLSQRFRLIQDNSISKTFYTIEWRLAKLIFENIKSDDHEINLINNLSNKEIAKIIGTTRAVVSRNLQKLKKDNIIDLKYKKILITDYLKLKEMIEVF